MLGEFRLRMREMNGYSKSVLGVGIQLASVMYAISILAYAMLYISSSGILNALIVMRSAYEAAPVMLATAVAGALLCDVIYAKDIKK